MVEHPNHETGHDAGALEVPTTLVQGPRPDESRTEELQLLVLEASGLAVHVVPRPFALSIGRADDCDVKLRDPLASRHHAVLHTAPLIVEDQRSANGTLIGTTRLQPGASGPVQIGQAISIGSSVLIVRRADPGGAQRVQDEVVAPPRVDAAAGAILGGDPAMKRLYGLIERIALGPINVLVLGETGVGKELVAETIHRTSPRREAPLVRINCAALSESLLESELFGHERGAFTGAAAAKPGLIEVADGGTVFLDEVGELSVALQAKLLRVIEAREVTRVGALRPRKIDVRFISATNRDLDGQIASGSFRLDLFFRLNGVSICVPPLRERPGDIIPLAETFLARVSEQLKLPVPPRLAPAAISLLCSHQWPGNVRELRNAIERAVLLCSDGSIEPADLSLGQLGTAEQRQSVAARPALVTMAPPQAHGDAQRDDETSVSRARILDALEKCHGNQTRAAKLLGMPRRTFVAKLPLYNIPRPRKNGVT